MTVPPPPSGTSAPEDAEPLPPEPPVELTLTTGAVTRGPHALRVTLKQLFVGLSASEPPSVEATLHLARDESEGELELSVRGRAPASRTWYGFRLTLLDGTPDEQHATITVGGRYQLPKTVRLERKQRTKLTDDLELTFTGHSHKRTMEGGPPSPLMISWVLHTPAQGDEEREVTHSLHLDHTRFIPVGGHVLELVQHAYGEWMDVRVVSTP